MRFRRSTLTKTIEKRGEMSYTDFSISALVAANGNQASASSNTASLKFHQKQQAASFGLKQPRAGAAGSGSKRRTSPPGTRKSPPTSFKHLNPVHTQMGSLNQLRAHQQQQHQPASCLVPPHLAALAIPLQMPAPPPPTTTTSTTILSHPQEQWGAILDARGLNPALVEAAKTDAFFQRAARRIGNQYAAAEGLVSPPNDSRFPQQQQQQCGDNQLEVDLSMSRRQQQQPGLSLTGVAGGLLKRGLQSGATSENGSNGSRLDDDDDDDSDDDNDDDDSDSARRRRARKTKIPRAVSMINFHVQATLECQT